MMNPLIKRIPRELKKDFGKYFVIFGFMVMLIALVSGYLVAGDSIGIAFNEAFDKYKTENGHVTFDKQPPEEILEELEKKSDLTFYEMWYIEEKDKENDKKFRIYKDREDINLECVMEGEMPSLKNEIAIDRVFAKNNEISVGDTIKFRNGDFTVSGFVALPDYSTLYDNNSDMMFDAINFSIAIVTEEAFDTFKGNINYNYSWLYNFDYDMNDKIAAAEKSDDFIDNIKDVLTEYDEDIVQKQVDEIKENFETAITEYGESMMKGKELAIDELSVELSPFMYDTMKDAVKAQMEGKEFEMPSDEEMEDEIDKTEIIALDDYLPDYLNKAIYYAGDDIGADVATFVLFDYIVTCVLAFVFAVTTSNTIVSEAGVIGTLRASGYSKSEVRNSFMILPIIVTLVSAVVGNVLGYTVMKNSMADLLYNSYSLCTYETKWNPDAFVKTTVVPIILMFVINVIVISSKLKLSPLKFIKRDLSKNKKKKAIALSPKIPFSTRFSMRIIFHNLSNYAVMIIGIILGAVIIVFSDILGRILIEYKDLVSESLISNYQYVLSDTVDTENDDAEKYCMIAVESTDEKFLIEDISVYGIEKDSQYISADIPEGKVLVSNSMMKKFGYSEGDTIKLKDKYSNDYYEFEIAAEYTYDAGLAVFMPRKEFNKMFDKDAKYFTGYFSDTEIDDIDEDDIVNVITEKDFSKMADQLENSMGGFMASFKYVGLVMFILIMYVLSKQVIERNSQSVSMCKILGFKNGEIGKLYVVSTSVAVVIGLGLSVPVSDAILRAVFEQYLYQEMTGYFPYIFCPESFILTVVIGLISYAVVAVIQMMKINKIPKAEALKNTE